jgi:hypothetical protein
MKNIKLPNFFYSVCALILGPAIYRGFDFESMRFENNALAVLYIIVFLFAIYGIVKDYRKPAEKQ